MWWGCIGSLNMLEYKVMRLLTGSKGTALSWESLDRVYEGLVIGWSTSIGYDGKVLAIPKDRFEN